MLTYSSDQIIFAVCVIFFIVKKEQDVDVMQLSPKIILFNLRHWHFILS